MGKKCKASPVGGREERIPGFPNRIWEMRTGQFHSREFQYASEDSSAGTFFKGAPFFKLTGKKKSTAPSHFFFFFLKQDFLGEKHTIQY